MITDWGRKKVNDPNANTETIVPTIWNDLLVDSTSGFRQINLDSTLFYCL